MPCPSRQISKSAKVLMDAFSGSKGESRMFRESRNARTHKISIPAHRGNFLPVGIAAHLAEAYGRQGHLSVSHITITGAK
jgi:hypothetical protein